MDLWVFLGSIVPIYWQTKRLIYNILFDCVIGGFCELLHFSTLKLSGFKSFVDQTDLTIELGLTGIVGPNGCGKSNLVEALKWVMGETSARQLRGGEMEEVIFLGSDSRPSQNIAEVTVCLDNSERSAPSQFNNSDNLEIIRRIERDKGSSYRVNGSEARARDVQLLFADQATGARSTALVSQGRIGSIISAKPDARRMLLEEAAGIRGLHARRHETELRLKAADTNLDRLDDILVTLDTQKSGLKKQAKQAARYRNLSDHIRKAEATFLYIRWVSAEQELKNDQDKLQKVDSLVVQKTRTAAEFSALQTEQASKLPAFREAEATAAAEFHRFRLALEGLETEEKRIEQERLNCENLLQQLSGDQIREEGLSKDAVATIKKLEDERIKIVNSRDHQEKELLEATEVLEKVTLNVDQLEIELTAQTEKVVDADARRVALKKRKEELAIRLSRLSERQNEIRAQCAQVKADAPDADAVQDASQQLKTLELDVKDVSKSSQSAEASRILKAEAWEDARRQLQTKLSSVTELEAEKRALIGFLKNKKAESWPLLVDKIEVEQGFEIALSAALGEDIDASTDDSAPLYWRALKPYDHLYPLPIGVVALSTKVSCPTFLNRRLSQIGIVDNVVEGQKLSENLKQGQRLVTRDGALWRWDGFTIMAGAPTPMAARLEQRNRLTDVKEKLKNADNELKKAEAVAEEARKVVRRLEEVEREARSLVSEKIASLEESRRKFQTFVQQIETDESMIATLVDQDNSMSEDYIEIQTQIKDTETEVLMLPDSSEANFQLATLRQSVSDLRSQEVKHRIRYDGLKRKLQDEAERLNSIKTDMALWGKRGEESNRKQSELDKRQKELDAKLVRLIKLPEEIKDKKNTLLKNIDVSDAQRKITANALSEAEAALAEADKKFRNEELTLTQSRESRIRAEGDLQQSQLVCKNIEERIFEKLDCSPETLFALSGLKDESLLPTLELAERKVDRLSRERDTMGPVNLRAEEEMSELARQIDTLSLERDDLINAIEKLRRGIKELNHEGRQRLITSFDAVNSHFQKVFVKLFGGGHAHLELSGSEDPLQAGLEILASPPGKKLQSLTLLSGGEQALTALALLFAVFLTNPAPICVLDEVDAPLDDANVDRFCSMLGEFSENINTRFLVITHHRITMARMDRLFGVTMSERGVSQLVSVDLQNAEALRKTA